MLPPALVGPVFDALRQTGDVAPVRRTEPVRGGYESTALCLSTRNGRYCLKWSERLAADRYRREVAGLTLLREVGALRVPTVIAVGGGVDGMPLFLLQEWLDRPSSPVYLRRVGAALGTQIARLHLASTLYGQPSPGYGLGLLPDDVAASCEPGAWYPDWVACYRQLLQHEIDQGLAKERLSVDLAGRLDRVLSKLDRLLGGVARRPSLSHGDLHKRNVMCDRDGTPVLVDQALVRHVALVFLAFVVLQVRRRAPQETVGVVMARWQGEILRDGQTPPPPLRATPPQFRIQ